jgi:SAM-dependent methyltransferase
MTDRETLAVYDAQTTKYADMTDVDQPGKYLRDFIACFAADDLILDLGCGPATSAAHMRAAGLQVDAVDASEEMVRLANKVHDIDAQQATFDDLDAVDSYDGVWANFSLLHAPRGDMPRHLAAVATALKPSGLLHIGLKTGTGDKRDSIGRFYSYYTDDEISGLLADAGFRVLKKSFGADTGLSGDVSDYIIVVAICLN